MLDFVLGGLEVEVVREGVGLASGIVKFDTELKLTPAVFGDAEGRFLEVCMRLDGDRRNRGNVAVSANVVCVMCNLLW